jgi:hypothetical protein
MIHQKTIDPEWKEENLLPFDELIISWNAKRPVEGNFLFYVSLKVDEWSSWLFYASWGSDGQAGSMTAAKEVPVRVYQDTVEVLEGKRATGFQIKIVPEGKSSLDHIYGLHVYTNGEMNQLPQQTGSCMLPVDLQVKGLSQMTLHHLRAADLCSPTATTALVRYLSNNNAHDPVDFAQKAWDRGCDLFGNWVLNVAHASSELGPLWDCFVERLSGFEDLYQRLHQGTPVIVSVRGPLQGSALPYAKGHLIVVSGYNPLHQKVLCMDPAFSTDEQTLVSYDLSEFIQAWNRRGKIAYVFEPRCVHSASD